MAHLKRSKLTEVERQAKTRKLMRKYPVPATSSLEVKEELFDSFKDATEFVQSFPFSESRINTPVHRCVRLKRGYRRPREHVLNDALKVLQTALLADQTYAHKTTANHSFFRNSRFIKTPEAQDYYEKRIERVLNFGMRVEERTFDVCWWEDSGLAETTIVFERSVKTSADRNQDKD